MRVSRIRRSWRRTPREWSRPDSQAAHEGELDHGHQSSPYRPLVRARRQRRADPVEEGGRLRWTRDRLRLSDAGRRRRRSRGGTHLLDQHGRAQQERWVDRACRRRRSKQEDDRPGGRHVHAEAAPARSDESEALLVGPRGHARHARQPRRLAARDAGRNRPRGRRPSRRDQVVRRRERRSRTAAALLDTEGPRRRGTRPHLPGEHGRSERGEPRRAHRHRGALRRPARAHRSGPGSHQPSALLDGSRGPAARKHGQPCPDGRYFGETSCARDPRQASDGSDRYRPRRRGESDVPHRSRGLPLRREPRRLVQEAPSRRPGQSHRHRVQRAASKGVMNMSYDKPIRRVAIVGTGVIGASWAAQYLARGFDVVATDPAPNAEANLRKYVADAWPALTTVGLSPGASQDRLRFTASMKEALSQADFVQENGPERPEFKIKLFADMDDATPIDSLIASSSSGITPSVMQSQCKHPERVLVGHPFNPPHIVPLVEVVGGTKTSADAIQQAMAFYASIGKKPIHLRKELPGHVANRLQAALYKEIMYLIQHDVLSVEDADVAVSYGPGPRWGVMGPSLQWHLGGGAGGIKHFMDHF